MLQDIVSNYLRKLHFSEVSVKFIFNRRKHVYYQTFHLSMHSFITLDSKKIH